MEKMNQTICYDFLKDRLTINGTELHCGDVVQIHLPEGWKRTRVEYNDEDGRYLVGYRHMRPIGITAKLGN